MLFNYFKIDIYLILWNFIKLKEKLIIKNKKKCTQNKKI